MPKEPQVSLKELTSSELYHGILKDSPDVSRFLFLKTFMGLRKKIVSWIHEEEQINRTVEMLIRYRMRMIRKSLVTGQTKTNDLSALTFFKFCQSELFTDLFRLESVFNYLKQLIRPVIATNHKIESRNRKCDIEDIQSITMEKFARRIQKNPNDAFHCSLAILFLIAQNQTKSYIRKQYYKKVHDRDYHLNARVRQDTVSLKYIKNFSNMDHEFSIHCERTIDFLVNNFQSVLGRVENREKFGMHQQERSQMAEFARQIGNFFQFLEILGFPKKSKILIISALLGLKNEEILQITPYTTKQAVSRAKINSIKKALDAQKSYLI